MMNTPLPAAHPDDLDHAKAVVRSAGYSLVSQKFIVNFSEFIQDWLKGDFDLPKLAALDVQSCFDAWQEEDNQAEVRQEAQSNWLLTSTQELAKSIARRCYPDVPQFEVLDDLVGVISQIDNMVTGMERKAWEAV